MAYKKRKIKRKRKTKRRYTNMSRRITTLARDGQLVKMRWSEVRQLSQEDYTTAAWIYRANSIYDPDFSGAGTSPLSYKEASGLYHQYQVVGSKIKVTFMPRGAGVPLANALVGIQLSDRASYEQSWQTIIEHDPNYRMMSAGYGNDGRCILKKYYSAKKYHKVKDLKDNDELKAFFGANPVNAAYYLVYIAPQDLGAVGNVDVDLIVDIEYIVRLTEPRHLMSNSDVRPNESGSVVALPTGPWAPAYDHEEAPP